MAHRKGTLGTVFAEKAVEFWEGQAEADLIIAGIALAAGHTDNLQNLCK